MESSADVARVGVVLRADQLDPSEVSQALGIEATRAFSKGELSAGKRAPRPWGLWTLEVEDADVERAARRLLSLLADKRGPLDQVARRFHATVSVSIWWEPDGGQGGYTLSSATLAELATLGERIDFYFASAEDSGSASG
ncbi:MAG: DUF4279 domain-containing protein [Minicystis sp.]